MHIENGRVIKLDDAKNIILLFMDPDKNLIQKLDIGEVFPCGVLYQEGFDRIAMEIIKFSEKAEYKKMKEIKEVRSVDGNRIFEVHMYC